MSIRFEPKNDLEIKNCYNLVFQMIALFVVPKLGIHSVIRIQNLRFKKILLSQPSRC